MSEANFTFRVDSRLKEAFVRAAKERNRSASLLLRDYMQQYVQEIEPPSHDRREQLQAAAEERR